MVLVWGSELREQRIGPEQRPSRPGSWGSEAPKRGGASRAWGPGKVRDTPPLAMPTVLASAAGPRYQAALPFQYAI